MRNIIIIAALSLVACSAPGDKALASLMDEMRTAYAQGRDTACLVAIDSLRARFPKAVAERREALALHQKAALRIAQTDLARTDTALERAKRDFSYMASRVATLREQGVATASQLTAVTQQRLRRDSLQVRFDVLCAKIRYIHRRQKQL